MSYPVYGRPEPYATHRDGRVRADDGRRPRCCCAGCAAGSFLVALAFFLGVVALVVAQPKRSPEIERRRQAALSRWDEPPPSRPPAEVRALRERVERAAEQAERAARPGGTKSFSTSVHEDEVNSLLATDPRIRKELAAKGIRQLTVLFESGRVLIDGVCDVGGLSLRVSADAVPAVRPDGTVDLRIENARAGRFPIPADKMAQARTELAKALAMQDPSRGRVTSLEVLDGEIRVSGEATGELPDVPDLTGG